MELRTRGVKDILIITSDDLPGIQEAIKAVYPDVAYQGYVVHIIRNSLKYITYKDLKEFSSPTEEAALVAFDELKKKWHGKYKLGVDVWERNWSRMKTMFSFTEEVRVLMYTTNPIESFIAKSDKEMKFIPR